MMLRWSRRNYMDSLPTYSNSDKTVAIASLQVAQATPARYTGKWYLEAVINAYSSYPSFGVMEGSIGAGGSYEWKNRCVYLYNGNLECWDGSSFANYAVNSLPTTGSVIRMGLDIDGGRWLHAVNGGTVESIAVPGIQSWKNLIPFVLTGGAGRTITVTLEGSAGKFKYPPFPGFIPYDGKVVDLKSLLTLPSVSRL